MTILISLARHGLMGRHSPSACGPICRISNWCAVAAVAGVLVVLLIPGPDFDRTHRYPPVTNVGTDTVALAGEYHKGRGRGGGWELSVLPDARHSVFLGTCTGTGHRESGFVRRADDCYVLSPTMPSEGSMDRVFLPQSALAVQGRGWYHPRRLVVASIEAESCIAVDPNPE